MFKYFLIFISCVNLFAVSESELASEEYAYTYGNIGGTKITGEIDKKKLERKQFKKFVPTKVKKKEYRKVDYSESVIMKMIKEEGEQVNSVNGIDLLAIPNSYAKDIKDYNKVINDSNSNDIDGSSDVIKYTSLNIRCRVDKDYKINVNTNIQMFCSDLKSSSINYKLNAIVGVMQDSNTFKLTAKPFMFEDDNGVLYSLDATKSKLYNGISGSENLATFVDKKAIESISKAMANTAAIEAPILTKDYLDKKNQPNTTTTENEYSSSTTSTASEVKASDYGISLLVSVVASGLSAGVDQMYRDLGYVYFIPKDSIIDGFLVVEVKE